MGKEQTAGLEDNTAVVAEVTAKDKKVQTPEEKDILVAGVAQMKTIGVSENLAKVLDLVADWNGEKENLSTIKESVITAFGGSEKLKDYIDGEFAEEVKGFAGLAKALPVLNNIKSFYARRENAGKGKVKTVQIQIDGKLYSCDAAYVESVKSIEVTERKQLILTHAGTQEAKVIEVL